MNIAVITGASSGIGRAFVRQVDNFYAPDEIWVIARRADRLRELADAGDIRASVKPLVLDLTDPAAIDTYGAKLKEAKPVVTVLVNAAGYGKLRPFTHLSLTEQLGMIDLNDKALTAMTYVTLPYMITGGRIFEMSSLSAFQPVPYVGVYAASKAYVLSLARSLNVELKKRGIRVMAVCPFWTKTEFFDRAVSDDTVNHYARYSTPEQVVSRAIRDMEKGKDVSVCGKRNRLQALAVKLLPHRLVMAAWCKQQKK